MNDPFAAHGLDHLSPSQINTFINNPCKWLLRVSGFQDRMAGVAAWRGSAVDHAITEALKGDLSQDKAVEVAAAYMRNQHTEFPEVDIIKFEKELKSVDEFVRHGLAHYRRLPRPTGFQQKIELQLDHLPIPIRGYADFVFEDAVHDLKTTKITPDKIKDNHARQVAIYSRALGLPAHVDYVLVQQRKQQVFSQPLADHHAYAAMQMVEHATRSMTRLLSVSANIEDVVGLLTPDFEDWMWSPAEIEAAKKLWRIQ